MDFRSILSSYIGSSGTIISDPQSVAAFEDWNRAIREGGDELKKLGTIKKRIAPEYRHLVKVIDKEAVALRRVGNQAVVASSGLKGLATAAKIVGKELMLAAGQFAVITAATWLISKAFEGVKWAYDEFSMSVKATSKRAEESAAALQETESELQSLEEELITIKERMAELQSMGSLTLTEQSELKTLQLESAELQKQIKLLKERKRIEQDELIKDNINAIHALDYQTTIKVDYGSSNAYNASLSLPEEFAYRTEQLEKYKQALADLSLDDANFEYYNKFYNDQIREQSDAITELSLAIDSYRINLEDVPEAEKAYFEALYNAENRALLESGIMSMDDFIQSSLGAEIYDKYIDKLQELSDTGVTAPSDIQAAFAKSMPEVLTLMSALGFTTEDLSEHIKSLKNIGNIVENIVSNQAVKRMKAFQEEADKLGNTVDLMNRPKVYNDDGTISTVSTVSASNEDGTKTVVVTPILPDGRVLSDDELNAYIDKLLNGEEIDVDIQLAMFEGDDSIEKSNEFAQTLHELQAAVYTTGDSINDFAEDLDFEITIDNVTDAFGKEFIGMLEDAGVTIEEFIEYLEALRENIEDISIADATSDLASIEKQLNSVAEAYNEFKDNKGKVSAETLSGLSESLSSVADTAEFERFITVLGNSASSIRDVDAALDDLVDIYFLQESTLNGLSVEYKDLYVAQLKQMGVTNAEVVVQQKLAVATIRTLTAKENLTEAEKEQLQAAQDVLNQLAMEDSALMTLANSCLTAAEKEELLKIRQDALVNGNFANAILSHANVLSLVAEAAGLSAEGVYEYAAALEYVAAYEEGIKKGMPSISAAERYEEAKETIANRQSIIDQLQNIIVGGGATSSYNPPPSGDKDKGSGDNKTPAEKRKEAYDNEKAVLDRRFELGVDSYETYYTKLTALGQKYFKNEKDEILKGNYLDWKEHAANLIKVREDQYATEKSELDAKFAADRISYQTYYNGLVALGKKYLLDENGNVLKDSEQEWAEHNQTLAEARRTQYEEDKTALEADLAAGKISYEKYYKELTKLDEKYFKDSKGNVYKENKDDYKEFNAYLGEQRSSIYDKQQAKLDEKLANGLISFEYYYSKSNELMNTWLAGRKNTAEKYADSVIELQDKVFDNWKDSIDKMETQMDQWTLDETWNPNMSEVDYWEAMLEDLEDDYINGMFSNTKEYYEIYYTIKEKIRNAQKDLNDQELEALEKQQDGIQDLIDMTSDMLKQQLEDQIEALEKQVDLYNEIVDAKKESLDLTRKENEYQRELEEHNKDLTELQAKAAVLALDDSREGRAQYAAIMEEIRKKQQEIADSQDDYTYDATIDVLDKATAQYQEKIQDKIDTLNESMKNQGKWLEYVYSYIKTTDPSALFKQLYDYNFKHGTGINGTIDDIKSASSDLLTEFQRDVPKILAYLQTETTKREEDGSGGGDDPTPDGNYKTISASLNKKVQQSVTNTNTDEENRKLVVQLKDEANLTTWYDDKNKAIYVGNQGDRSVTAGAYNLIQEMIEINSRDIAKSEKKKLLDTLLKQLKKKWSYGESYFEWSGSTAHLYKKSNKNSVAYQVFHDGYAKGFVGEHGGYSPTSKQKELLSLLESGELVFNRSQQGVLLSQLQTLQTLSDGIKRLQLDSIPGDTYGVGEINVNVNAPITINGSADADTLKELERFKKNLSNDVLSEVTDAMKRKGYSGNTAINARKK